MWIQEVPEQASLGPGKYSTGKVAGKLDTLRISFYVIHLSDLKVRYFDQGISKKKGK